MSEKHFRSIAKGVSYRVLGTAGTIGISFFVTGSLAKSLSIGGMELVSKIFLFYFHERVWLQIPWGKHKT